MTRGDVYLADLDPARGSEANKARPVILVGNDASLVAASRSGSGVVSVVPCTSNTVIRGPMHVVFRPTKLNGLRIPSKARSEQVRSIAVDRLIRPIGKLGVGDLAAVDNALRYHFAL